MRSSASSQFLLGGLLAGTLGCSTPNPNVRVARRADGVLQVEGPLAGPYKSTEELASRSCELMTRQPGAGATHGRLGIEYCALHYYALADDSYYLSYLSDISGDGPGGSKYCTVPRAIHELEQRDIVLTGPAHTHSINPELSDRDMGALRPLGWSPLGPSRFLEQNTGRVWERELYAFYRNRDGVCFAYSYNYATRIVSALRESKWVPIGKAEGEWGTFKPFEGRGWRP